MGRSDEALAPIQKPCLPLCTSISFTKKFYAATSVNLDHYNAIT